MTRLQSAYHDYNRLYFRSQLPSNVMVKWVKMEKHYGRAGGGLIEISTYIKNFPDFWQMTLLHEMAHVATDSEKADHGPRWRREMRRLARIGAFDKLW